MRFFIMLAAFFILSSCDNDSSKKSTTFAPAPPKQPTQIQNPPPTPTQPVQPTPPVATTNPLPILSFIYNEYVYDGTNEVHLELALSHPSDVPVVVDVALANGTALYQRDFGGFKWCENNIVQTVTFAPQQTHVDLKPIKIFDRAECNSEFAAMLVPESVQGAAIDKASVPIVLPCY